MNHDHMFVPAIRYYDLERIVQALEDIRDYMGVPPRVHFTINASGVTVEGGKSMELREGQQVDLSVVLKTASGNPAAYEKGSASWTSSDPATVSVDVDPSDELKATAKGLNGANNGSVVISFQCDGDPDAGPDQQRLIIGTLDVTCTAGEAMVVEISAGTPVDIPPAK